jgi:hypothetical protein
MATFIPPNFNLKNYLPAACKCGIHWMPWFLEGPSDHVDVGYSSDDPAVITRQLDKMQALGCADFVCEEYYGHLRWKNKPWYQRASLHMMDQCGERGVQFVLCPASDFMSDYGINKADATAVTGATIDLLNFAQTTYFIQPHYLKVAGQPLVMWFGTEQFPIDWQKVQAAYPNVKHLFRNAGGFVFPDPPGVSVSAGAYDWPSPWMTNDASANLLDPKLGPHFDFWKAAAQNPTKVAIGTVYAGFNDAVSTWRPTDPKTGQQVTRVLARRNGATLIDSLSIVPANAQFVQVCTWNDMEEGTDIEQTLTDDHSGKYVPPGA